MVVKTNHDIYYYFRSSKKFPSVWCAGCGMGIFVRALMRAIDKNGYGKDDIVMVSGIGCSGRMTAYVDFNTLHTTHGRALTFATGVKLAKPSLKVITIMGDGDALAIGGNHFIHAARRNMDITAIVINNNIYGMTGGQVSPGTPTGVKTTTTPYGNLESPFDICEIARAAGANFVARTTVFNVILMEKLIGQALNKKGFSVVEVISQCPTHYGKRSGFKNAVQMMEWQRDSAMSVEKASSLSVEELKGKFKIGVLLDRDNPSYCEKLDTMMKTLREQNNAL
jgi:2-oxoglutarate ferredoxin oxidoreductase subunit beta